MRKTAKPLIQSIMGNRGFELVWLITLISFYNNKDNCKNKILVWQLFKKNKFLISFGIVVLAFTVYGQSFFLAFFSNDIAKSFNITKSNLSLSYSIGTFAAALFLPLMGRLMDFYSPKKMLVIVPFGLIVGMLGLIFLNHPYLLFFVYFIIRLMGQSSLSLVITTFVTKNFNINRGRVLSIIMMGRYIGDALFPSIAVWALLKGGMSYSLFVLIILLIIFIIVPNLFFDFFKENSLDNQSEVKVRKTQKINFRILLKYPHIGLLMILGTFVPMYVTGLFFEQDKLIEVNLWSKELIARGFVIFSASQILSTYFSGFLVDRFRAIKLIFIPSLLFCLSVTSLLIFKGEMSCILFMIFLGLDFGMGGVVGPSALAEIAPKEILGQISGLNYFFLVISTSIAPVLYRFVIDQKISMESSYLFMVITTFGAAGILLFLSKIIKKIEINDAIIE